MGEPGGRTRGVGHLEKNTPSPHYHIPHLATRNNITYIHILYLHFYIPYGIYILHAFPQTHPVTHTSCHSPLLFLGGNFR